MNGNNLFREIGNIRDEWIVEAEQYQKKGTVSGDRGLWKRATGSAVFRKTLGMAASLVILIGIVVNVLPVGTDQSAAESAREGNMAANPEAVEYTMQISDMEYETTGGGMEDESGTVDQITAESIAEEAKEVLEDSRENTAHAENAVQESEIKTNLHMEIQSEEQREVLTVADGKIETGLELWQEFLDSIQAKEAAEIEIVCYTAEGDEVLERVSYNGKKFCLCIEHSQEGLREKGEVCYEAEYQYLETLESKNSNGEKVIEYVLTNTENSSTASEADIYRIFCIIE